MTNIKNRVLLFCKSKGLSIEPFLESIGMTYGSFKGKAKDGSLNSDAIENIYTKYPEINLVWLITGQGEMELKNNMEQPFEKDTYKNDTLNEKVQLLSKLVHAQEVTIKSQNITIDATKVVLNLLYEKSHPEKRDFESDVKKLYIDNLLNEAKNEIRKKDISGDKK